MALTQEQIQEILNRIEAGKQDENDLSALRRAFDSGQITLATGNKAVALGGDANDAVIITGDNNIVRLYERFDLEVIRDLLKEIFPQEAEEPPAERAYFEPETVYVPNQGPFIMGSSPALNVNPAETPQADITLPDYSIGKYPVTNIQYAEFINQTGYRVSPEMGWEGKKPPAEKPDHPVKGITWFDALAYCRWLSDITGKKYTLPTEAHWEKAARGMDGRRYPWGNEWAEDRLNCSGISILPVDRYPPQSPYGCCDMVGNLREWTCSLWGERRSQPDPQFRYPWVDDSRNSEDANSQIRRVLRGGTYQDGPQDLTCTARFSCPPNKSGIIDSSSGFRVMLKT
jgi:formylglycine-generating enzyme required for sulfatase activity